MRLREVDLQLPNAPFAAQPLQPQNICDTLPAPLSLLTVNRHFTRASQRPDAVLVQCMSKLNIQKTKIRASGPITSWEIDGETVETGSDFILGAPKSLQMVTAAMKLKDACSLEEKL